MVRLSVPSPQLRWLWPMLRDSQSLTPQLLLDSQSLTPRLLPDSQLLTPRLLLDSHSLKPRARRLPKLP